MVCRVMHVLFLTLLAALAVTAQQQAVVVDSLFGQAEFKRAGGQAWEVVAVGTRLFNNDLLRVHAGSGAKLAWPLKNLIVVRENSQVRINLHEDESTKSLTQHITVFFGALYFVVEQTLPRALTGRENLKVYTPTSIISIRGTSFLVEVAPGSGTTRVAVTNGTVQVQHIARDESLVLGSGMQTTVGTADTPALPQPVQEGDVDALKAWVDPGIVDQELEKGGGLKTGKVSEEGELLPVVTILSFAMEAEYEGRWKPEAVLAGMLAAQVRALASQLVMDTVVDASVDPLAVGQAHRSRYVVSGRLSSFEITRHAAVDPRAERYSEYARSQVTMHLAVLDIALEQVVYEQEFSSSFTDEDLHANSWARVSRTRLSFADSAFTSTVLGKAVRGVVTNAADAIVRIVTQMEN